METKDDAPVKEVLIADCGDLPEGAVEQPVNGQVQPGTSIQPPHFIS